MRLLLWSMVITSIVLFIWAEVATPIVQRKTMEDYHLPVHVTLYLERSMDDIELLYIVDAVNEWYTATNGQVVFDIIRLPVKEINPHNSLIMVNLTLDFPQIIDLDSLNHNSTLAYCDRYATLPYIGLVPQRIENGDFSAVVMHELGHYLGLSHSDTKGHPELGIGSLMNSNITLGANHITNNDLLQFCKLYECDARKLHGFSQVQ